MSADAYKAVRALPDDVWGQIEETRLRVPAHRRPSAARVQLVLREIAWCFVDDVGYADPTVAQITSTLKDMSADSVSECLTVLRDAGVVPVLRRSTRGLKGKPGRAPRRGLSFHSPKPSSRSRSVSAVRRTTVPQELTIDDLRARVEELDEMSRSAPSLAAQQRARLEWQYLREKLRQLENV
jgi:hypothetical protein